MSERVTNLETLLDLVAEADEGSARVSLSGVLTTVCSWSSR